MVTTSATQVVSSELSTNITSPLTLAICDGARPNIIHRHDRWGERAEIKLPRSMGGLSHDAQWFVGFVKNDSYTI